MNSPTETYQRRSRDPEWLILARALPPKIGIDFLPARLDGVRGTEMKLVSFDLHYTRLRLANPVWKQGNKHRVR
jgi:hypothetical protein